MERVTQTPRGEEAGRRDLTVLLQAWKGGDQGALAKLTPLVYAELRRRARHYMAGEKPGHQMQTTDLVHEAYLRLVDVGHFDWQNRAHFFAVSAGIMRRILVDAARSRHAGKRSASAEVPLDRVVVFAPETGADLIALDQALDALGAVDRRKSQVVELRFFGGLTADETAEVLGVSSETVARDWRLARMWLVRELTSVGGPESKPARSDS
jgi:RNA polymerase sigma-70 factor (ECF subfamily)